MKPHNSVSLGIASLLVISGLSMAILSPSTARAATSSRKQGSSTAPVAPPASEGPSNTQPPPIPVDEIIRRFSEHESQFKIARDNYTYTQEVLVEDVAPHQGQYQLTSDIIFTPEGQRFEKVTYAPESTLVDFSLSPEDQRDLENVQPFVLTAEDLPKYNVQYVGREKVDELNTYVFTVAPKKIEKNQRYFQGTIWVDDQDFAVVKTDGKAVPDLKDNLFPRFVTYRENIEGNFWFPTYTHADDILHFGTGDVHIRMTVRYTNYKRFGSTIKLGQSTEINAPPASQPAQK